MQYIIGGIILAAIICICLFLLKKYQKVYKEKKTSIEQADLKLRSLQNDITKLEHDRSSLTEVVHTKNLEVQQLDDKKRELNADISNQIENVEKLKKSYQTTEEEFKKSYMAERKTWLEERQEEYLRMQEDFVEQFKTDNRKKMLAAQELNDKLNELKSAADAAVEVAKRHAEEENFINFHSLQITEESLNDINALEKIIPTLSKEANEAISKVIWKVYYEKPYTDLIGRVVGSGKHTGIYRITNINSQMCYIGQAVDIAERWKQHIKRALNAEPRTQNKLYPAMYKEGLENFTFEIIEECEQNKLNEREDYWQNFYKAKEYGYSIK